MEKQVEGAISWVVRSRAEVDPVPGMLLCRKEGEQALGRRDGKPWAFHCIERDEGALI
jgi:hypothetical protein